MRPLGGLITWGSDAAEAAPPAGPVWLHSEIANEHRTFDPRIRGTQIMVQTGSQYSTNPPDDTLRWPD